MDLLKKHKLTKISAMTSVLVLVASAGNVLADADIAVQAAGTATAATANVDLKVVVPEILIFGVGAVGTDIAKLQWTIDNSAGAAVGNNQNYSGAAAPFTSPAPFATTATASVESNGGTGSSAATNKANLPVFLFSNNGSDVTITASISGGATGGGTTDALDHATLANTIPSSSFTSSDGGSISHPSLSTGSTADTSQTSGIVNLSDTWSYEYTPATVPAAGSYEARVTYVAAQP